MYFLGLRHVGHQIIILGMLKKNKIQRERESSFHILTQLSKERFLILYTSCQTSSVNKKGKAFRKAHHPQKPSSTRGTRRYIRTEENPTHL